VFCRFHGPTGLARDQGPHDTVRAGAADFGEEVERTHTVLRLGHRGHDRAGRFRSHQRHCGHLREIQVMAAHRRRVGRWTASVPQIQTSSFGRHRTVSIKKCPCAQRRNVDRVDPPTSKCPFRSGFNFRFCINCSLKAIRAFVRASHVETLWRCRSFAIAKTKFRHAIRAEIIERKTNAVADEKNTINKVRKKSSRDVRFVIVSLLFGAPAR